MRFSRSICLVAAALMSSSLAACSSGADSRDIKATSSTFSASSSGPSTATPNSGAVTSPAGGSVTSSDKTFNFVVPSGWNLSKNDKAAAYLSSATHANNVAPTIVVSKSSTSPAPALDDILQMATMQARQDGGSVSTLPSRTVGGEKAVGIKSEKDLKNVPVTQFYYAVAHNKTLYTIVLTSATKDAKSTEGTLNSFLGSWSWTVVGKKESTASGTTPAASSTTTSTSSKPVDNKKSSASSGSSSSTSASSSSQSAKASSTSTASSTSK